jgi:beta-galactosidase
MFWLNKQAAANLLFGGVSLLCATIHASESRLRLSLNDGWRFRIEPTIVAPAGENTVAVTDWLIKAGDNGEADAALMNAPVIDPGEWTAGRVGEDLTSRFRDRYVWFRTQLDPLLKAHPINGPRSIFFFGAGQRAVVYLNGRKIVEHTDNVRSLNASEVLQTGFLSEDAVSKFQEIDGVPQCFEACLEPYLSSSGPNVLTVMVRVTAKDLPNGLRGSVVLFSGFAPETQLSFDDSGWREVRVPHDYVIEGTPDPRYNNQRAALPLPRAFYRRKIEIPADYAGKTLWIEFDGIYRDSRVWLNGQYLGRHPSGYTGSRYDISAVANIGGRNELVVLVDPRVAEGWWYEGGGIYRHVWLNVADPLHVAPLGTHITSTIEGVSSETPSAKVTLKTRVLNQGPRAQSATLRSAILDPRGTEVASVTTQIDVPAGAEAEFTQHAAITAALLWSCETPRVYRVNTELVRDGRAVDTYTTTFGLRTIRFDPDHGFFLNEKHVKLQGFCNHHDFAGVGIAMPDNLQEWRIKKLQEMGANAWRCSHSVPSSEFLDACDRLGMLVIDENRHLASTIDRKTGSGHGYVTNDLSELEFMLRRDRNHPSIIAWCLANEEKDTPANSELLRSLVEHTRRFDDRPTTAAIIFADGRGIEAVPDLGGLNYSHKSYDVVRKNLSHKPLLSTENGSARATRGIYYDYPASEDPKKNPPYHIRNYSTWFAAKTAPEANENITQWKPIADREWLAGGFYWTGFDYRGEPSPSLWPAISSHFGMFDLCGFPKDNYYYYKAWWTKQPVIHVMPHWNWVGQKEGQPMRVVVFSNAATIELLLNGRSLGSQPMPPHASVEWQVPYEQGRLEARGTMTDGRMIADIVETTGKPAALRLRSDMKTLRANHQDIAVAEVSVVDHEGRVVPTANDFVTFTLTGPGSVAGVGNGDPICHEPDVASQRSAFNGHCAALIRAGGNAGTLTLTATAPGLETATLTLQVEVP